jgi:hypothetical protein
MQDCEKVTDEKKQFLTSRPRYTDDHDKLNKKLTKIKSGTHIVATLDEHINILSDKYEQFNRETTKIKFVEMEQSKCHGNCGTIFGSQIDDSVVSKIYSGYALSADGLWRFHSWCLTESGTLIETTEERLIYYGIPIKTLRLKSNSKNMFNKNL